MGLVRPQVAYREREPNALYLHFYRGHVGLGRNIIRCNHQCAGGLQPTIAGCNQMHQSNGDVIAIAAGTYYEHSLNTDGKAITIGSASGNLDVTIDAQQGEQRVRDRLG